MDYEPSTGHNGQHAQNAHTAGPGPTDGTSAFPSPSNRTESSGIASTVTNPEEPTTTMSEALVAWLEARGLDPELASRMGWFSAKTSYGDEWVKIPYRRGGKVINHKSRKLAEKKFLNDKGAEHDLWNVDCLSDATLDGYPLIITEGEFDALACIQAGHQRTVSLPDGWSAGLENEDGQPKFEIFKRNEEKIKKASVIIAAVDDDETGHSLLRAITNFFEDCDVRFIRYPEGCKDANDVLFKVGAEALKSLLDGAKSIDPPGGLITGFSDLPPRPLRTMWKLDEPKLERLIAFRTREISVLTGVPGSGKTAFATWLCHHLTRLHDIRMGIGSFETDPEELFQHLAKMRCGGLEMLGTEKLAELRLELDRNYRVFHRIDTVGKETHGIDWLKKMVHTLAARDGCNFIIIDPWNELEHVMLPGESSSAYINYALLNLAKWADKYDIHIMIVAHPKKMHEGRKPAGYDIADAAAWANKPRLGLTIHQEDNDSYGPHVTLTAWKVSNRQATGCAPGFARLQFDQSAMVYRAASTLSGNQ